MTTGEQYQGIAGFWRRIGAFVIDICLLAGLGYLLSLPLESVFMAMGSWGRVVGFAIAMVYFGLMNSRVFNGQTPGKRIMKVRVVNACNEPITVGRSLLRYSVLGIPFLLNHLQLTDDSGFNVVTYVQSVILFGAILSVIYLYVFNRTTRQSLHDLATGTFVVKEDVRVNEADGIWKGHFVVVAGMFALILALPLWMKKTLNEEPLNSLMVARDAVLSEPGIRAVTLNLPDTSYQSVGGDRKKVSSVVLLVELDSGSIDDAGFARHLALTVMQNYPDAVSRDVVQVVLSHGYDIGIWSSWTRMNYRFNPQELAAAE